MARSQFHWIRICTNQWNEKRVIDCSDVIVVVVVVCASLTVSIVVCLLLFVLYFSSSVVRVGVFKDSLANFAAEDSVSRN